MIVAQASDTVSTKRKVLITGAAGMIGRNLLADPAAQHWEILAPSRADLDLSDRKALRDFLVSRPPDVVIHLAGRVGGIQANIADPVGFLLDNVDVGRNVISAAFEAGVTRLLNLGSSCMYPRDREAALVESDLLTGPLEPTNEGYALAKILTAKLCEYINRTSSSIHYKTIIPCNIYGPFDKFSSHAAHLIPAAIDKIARAKRRDEARVEIWGDGTARREFMYAGDLADAIWKAAQDMTALPDLMNVGVGSDHSVLEYYKAIADVLEWRGEFVFDTSRPSGMSRKLCDVTLQEAWGWRPETSLERGIALTAQYWGQAAS